MNALVLIALPFLTLVTLTLSRKCLIESKGRLYASLIFSVVVFEIAALLVLGGKTTTLDLSIDRIVRGLSVPFLVSSFKIFFAVLTSEVLTVLVFLLGMYLVIRKKYLGASIFVFGAFFAALAGLAYKHFFAVARPLVPLADASGYSFPSGHAILAAVLFTFIVYIGHLIHGRVVRDVSLWVLGLGLIVIALGRLYVHVHWFSDVVAGLALGNAVAIVSILIAHVLKDVVHNNTRVLHEEVSK